MNAVDVILLVVIAAAFGVALWKWIDRRRKGKCCGSCEGCSGCGKADYPSKK